MRPAALLCRLFGHKVAVLDDLSAIPIIRCVRCEVVLSEKLEEAPKDIPKHLLFDKTYTNGCHGKTRFASFVQAENRLARMKARPATLHPYHCTHCKGVHLGN